MPLIVDYESIVLSIRESLFDTLRMVEFARHPEEKVQAFKVGVVATIQDIDRKTRPEPDPDACRGVRRRASHYRAS